MNELTPIMNDPEFIQLRGQYQAAVNEYTKRIEAPGEFLADEKLEGLQMMQEAKYALGRYLARAGAAPETIYEVMQAIKPRQYCPTCGKALS